MNRRTFFQASLAALAGVSVLGRLLPAEAVATHTVYFQPSAIRWATHVLMQDRTTGRVIWSVMRCDQDGTLLEPLPEGYALVGSAVNSRPFSGMGSCEANSYGPR
jgi:hypothetical protein